MTTGKYIDFKVGLSNTYLQRVREKPHRSLQSLSLTVIAARPVILVYKPASTRPLVSGAQPTSLRSLYNLTPDSTSYESL
jgi:hypothetical protein